jgi:formylglycine-generating enzyme required for sulfatase activity
VTALAVTLLFRSFVACGSSPPAGSASPPPTPDAAPPVDASRQDTAAEASAPDAAEPADVFVPPFDAGPILRYDDFGCTPAPVAASCINGLCRLPKGCFVMGSPEDAYDHAPYGEDIHRVDFTHDLWVDQSEMTVAAWKALALPETHHDQTPQAGLPCEGPDGQCPVTNVSFFDAVAAANARSAKEGLPTCYELSACTGTIGTDYACTNVVTTTAKQADCRGYRLPTRAEFEFAARAGLNAPLPGGQYTNPRDECYDEPNLTPWAWYCLGGNRVHPTKGKRPNNFGIYDIFGNAGEWYPLHRPRSSQVEPLTALFCG